MNLLVPRDKLVPKQHTVSSPIPGAGDGKYGLGMVEKYSQGYQH